jgi:ubiquinone/menaquinone biosynthesis C-methylase UbiE
MKKLFSPFIKLYNKSSIWGKVLMFTMVIVLLVLFFKPLNKKEGFELTNDFNIKVGTNVYDDFYSNIYDDLVFKDLYDNYEYGELLNKTGHTSRSIVLDVGSGTGDGVADLAKQGYKVIGIDSSPSMLKKAKQKYPKYDFKLADALNAMEFQPNSFTHILCMFFTLYEMKNKQAFFNNCMRWLMPGGFLILQLVDRDSLPTTSFNPLSVMSIKPIDFEYNTKFIVNKDNNSAIFEEKIKTNDGKVRKNEHHLYLEDRDEIIQMAQDAGFDIFGAGEMKQTEYGYQYIYILRKSN